MITILSYKGQDPVIVPPDSTLLVSAATHISRREIELETDKPKLSSVAEDCREMQRLQREVIRVDAQVAAVASPNVNVIAHYPKPSFGTINIDRTMLREAYHRAHGQQNMLLLTALEFELFGEEKA